MTDPRRDPIAGRLHRTAVDMPVDNFVNKLTPRPTGRAHLACLLERRVVTHWTTARPTRLSLLAVFHVKHPHVLSSGDK